MAEAFLAPGRAGGAAAVRNAGLPVMLYTIGQTGGIAALAESGELHVQSGTMVTSGASSVMMGGGNMPGALWAVLHHHAEPIHRPSGLQEQP